MSPSIPCIHMEKHPDKPTAVVKKAVLDKGVLRLFVRQELSEGGTLRNIVIEEGKYAGAPYVQFTLSGKTLCIYHNHGKTRPTASHLMLAGFGKDKGSGSSICCGQ